MTLTEHKSNLEALLADRARLSAEINRVAQAGQTATSEAGDLLKAPSAFDDPLALSKVALLRTKADVAGPILLERLQADLAEIDSRLTPAIEDTIQAALRVTQGIEEVRYGAFREALEPFFDGGLTHRAFSRDPHGIAGPEVREWFIRTSAYLALDWPKRTIGGLSSKWSPNPAHQRAESLLRALAMIPDDAPAPDAPESVLANVAKVATMALAAVGLR